MGKNSDRYPVKDLKTTTPSQREVKRLHAQRCKHHYYYYYYYYTAFNAPLESCLKVDESQAHSWVINYRIKIACA